MQSLLANSQTKRTPRPHQQEAISSVIRGLRSADRGQLIMACGTGKTLTSFWIREELESGLTLVLLPSLNLLSQTLKEWESESEGLNWICVCSDKSVAKDEDEWVVNASDLGISVTSDVDEIQDFLIQTPNGVIFSTYQSSPLVAEAQDSEGVPHFDLVIGDEAHRISGKVSTAFACVLDDQQIRANKRLFMTATPRILGLGAIKQANNENIDVACMEDKSLFGDVLYELNFSEAINRDLLCDYEVVVVGVNDPMIQSEIIRNSVISTLSGNRIDSQTLANHIALSKAIKDYSLKRVITFHHGVKQASNFCDHHSEIVNSFNNQSYGDMEVQTGFVCGDMPSTDRNIQINKLQTKGDEVRILSNARCLSEGVNIPSLDAIAFIDPRKSVVDIAQAVGRVIRKNDSKSHGYIILPVYLGNSQDATQEILASRFKDIFKVLLALKSQDDSLNATLNRLRISNGNKVNQQKVKNILNKITLNLPSEVSEEFSESITTMIVKNTTSTWMEKYGELCKYVEENGHAVVPQIDPQLGAWVMNQRHYKNTGELSQERIDLLNEIGFVWKIRGAMWDKNYEMLSDYFEKNGHSDVENDHPLFSWVYTQRHEYKKGNLSQEKQDLLAKLDFKYWFLIDKSLSKKEILLNNCKAKLQRWEDAWVDQLEQYQESLKDGNINKVVYSWLTVQRYLYKKGELSQNKIDLLFEVDPYWNLSQTKQEFRAKVDELRAYIKEHGFDSIRPLTGANAHPLGRFVVKQRERLRGGKLSIESMDLLNSIGFVWNDPSDYVWVKGFKKIKKSIKNTETKVLLSHPEVADWVSQVRIENKIGKIPSWKSNMISQLKDFDWREVS